MEANYKITIPKPCHEDWDKMVPDQTGRFCNSCAKSVVDFTGMKTAEIQDYFIKNQGRKVCGRFKTEQLDSIIIQIPREILFSQVHYHKIFMLALLVCMGTSLFSCQSDGHKKKIDGVEVVDSTNHGMITGGMPMPVKEKPQKDTVCTKKATKWNGIVSGDIVVTPDSHNPPPPPLKKDYYLTAELDMMPSYPGGIRKFYEYVNSNLSVSEEDKKIKQTMIFSFMVEKDGSLTNIKIIRGVDDEFNAKVVKLLETSPKWIPGESDGEKVRTLYTIPIRINP